MSYEKLINESIELKNKINKLKKEKELTIANILKIEYYELPYFDINDKDVQRINAIEKALVESLNDKVTIHDEFIINEIEDQTHLFHFTFYWKYAEFILEVRCIFIIKDNKYTLLLLKDVAVRDINNFKINILKKCNAINLDPIKEIMNFLNNETDKAL